MWVQSNYTVATNKSQPLFCTNFILLFCRFSQYWFNCNPESAVGLSYGTLSEVSDVEKTAEEIKSSKQRSFVRVSDIQGNLQAALEQLLYGFQYYRDYYANRHTKPAEVSCTFGDGVLEDTDKEFQRRLQMVQARVLKPELLLSWYFGCEEAEALQMLPEQQDAGGLFDGGAF